MKQDQSPIYSRLLILLRTIVMVTLNVTDLDRINIVSPQAVHEMLSFSMYTRLMSSSPSVNSLVKNRLFKTATDIDEPPFQFMSTTDKCIVLNPNYGFVCGRHDAA